MSVALFADIQTNLDHVNEIMLRELKSDQSFLNQIISYLLDKRGKMIRPALVILAGKICNSETKADLASAGAAVEILHMATLVHDDIVDDAEIRRGLTTVNKLYGNQLAVLLGDYFYAKSLKILTGVHDGLDLISRIVANLVQGEFIQYANSFKLDQKMEDYWSLINYKTAYFISNCCRLGALLNEGSAKQVEALARYGQNLGMAFQICDDLLDFSANPQKLGKPTYKDVANGIYTLPVLHALKHSPDQDTLRRILQKDKMVNDDLRNIASILHNADSIEYAYYVAEGLCVNARRELIIFPDNQEKEMLEGLTRFNLKREF